MELITSYLCGALGLFINIADRFTIKQMPASFANTYECDVALRWSLLTSGVL